MPTQAIATDRLLVLNYHGVQLRMGDYEWTGPERVYVLGRTDFERQLDLLRSMDVAFIGQDGLASFLRGDEVPGTLRVMLTFDDGHISHLERVAPLLTEKKLSGLFFISPFLAGRKGYMDWQGLRDLSGQGFEIGSHGYSHQPLTGLSAEALGDEFYRSREILQEKLGVAVRSFSVPRGYYRPFMKTVARNTGYSFMFTSDFGLNERSADPFGLKRIAVRRNTHPEEIRAMARGELGRKPFVEAVKAWARQTLPPEFYDRLAGIKYGDGQGGEERGQ